MGQGSNKKRKKLSIPFCTLLVFFKQTLVHTKTDSVELGCNNRCSVQRGKNTKNYFDFRKTKQKNERCRILNLKYDRDPRNKLAQKTERRRTEAKADLGKVSYLPARF